MLKQGDKNSALVLLSFYKHTTRVCTRYISLAAPWSVPVGPRESSPVVYAQIL